MASGNKPEEEEEADDNDEKVDGNEVKDEGVEGCGKLNLVLAGLTCTP